MRQTRKSYGIAIALVIFFIAPLAAMAQNGMQAPIGSQNYVDANGYPIYPPSDVSKNKAFIERGEYLAKAGDCAN